MLLAYIDPGFGALVWQIVISGFVGFLFYLKKTRRWIVNLFLKMFGRNQKSPDAVVAIAVEEKMKAKSSEVR